MNIPTGLRRYYFRQYEDAMNRIVLLATFGLIGFFQMSFAAKVYTDAEQREIANLIFGLDPWNIWLVTLSAWAFLPVLTVVVRVSYAYWKNGQEVWTESYWSEYA